MTVSYTSGLITQIPWVVVFPVVIAVVSSGVVNTAVDVKVTVVDRSEVVVSVVVKPGTVVVTITGPGVCVVLVIIISVTNSVVGATVVVLTVVVGNGTQTTIRTFVRATVEVTTTSFPGTAGTTINGDTFLVSVYNGVASPIFL
jgi:hypothetical protein